MSRDDMKTVLLIFLTIWFLFGAAVGFGYALFDKVCPRKNIAAYLNPAYIIVCETFKPRWEINDASN